MTTKKIILISLVIAIVGAAGYAYKEYNRKVKDLSKVKPDMKMQAEDIVDAFEQNEIAANGRYLDKVIEVTGKIRDIEKDTEGNYSIVLAGRDMSSVRCSMDSAYGSTLNVLTNGNAITIKGACTGFKPDDLLGSDVILNRCVIAD